MKIDPEAWYAPGSPEMNQLASKPTLANWRCAGIGPDYTKIGNRILYFGSDLLSHLEGNKVSAKEAA